VPRIAIVAPSSASGEIGGAERLFAGVCKALTDFGFASEVVSRPIGGGDFNNVLRSYLTFHDLNLDAFDGVVSTKSPTYAVHHRNHVCYLVHTMRIFYDMFDWERLRPSEEQLLQRRFIQQLDARLLSPKRLKALISIGAEVSERLRIYNDRHAPFLRCPTTLAGLRGGLFDYIFVPGRLHRWKRVHLAIDAVRSTDLPLRLVIAGEGEDEDNLRRRANGDARIDFVGRVSEDSLLELYANALTVIFPPRSEDLGLVTFEAFLAGKPVITCLDSGEPARIVQHGVSGFIAAPSAQSIAEYMRRLANDSSLASDMGAAGRASIVGNTWQGVAIQLAAALGFASHADGRRELA
jgi:glycosyltransferase involved in cell wall biosynthesis